MTNQYAMGDAGRRRRSFTETVVFYGAVFLALLSLYDPLKDAYTAWLFPEIGDEPVQVAVQQQKLTEKNLDCLIGATPQEVPLSESVKVRLLACSSGDIQVAVYPNNAPAKLRWITPHAPLTKAAGVWPFDAIISKALAQARPGEARLQLAQAPITNICSAWQDPSRKAVLIRVTNENGKCFKEIVNVFTGRVDYREEAPCNTPCK